MKRSIAKEIRSKQSSAYSGQRSSAPAIHQIDGSSAKELSRRTTKPLRSWPNNRRGVSSEWLDEQAEAMMNQGYSRIKNPICSSCYVQKALNGSCSCTD
jgi:hypothetical protein